MDARGLDVAPYEPIYWIVRPLRERGKRIPRFVWQAGEEEAPIGALVVTWERSDQHHRQMHVARLLGGSKNILPMIRDVHIITLNHGDLTLAGFEQVEDREYAQTWYCRVLRKGWRSRGKPEDPTGAGMD
jgi:hypothetical protein